MSQGRLERLNLVLRAIRSTSQLLVRERDRSQLIQGVCDILVENRGYYSAWIALLGQDHHLLEVASSGTSSVFEIMVARMRAGVLTDCARESLSRSGVYCIEGPRQQCRDCPLSEHYEGRGAMTIRLEHESRVYGILCISAPPMFATDLEEQNLIAEIASDIAFGLHNIELTQDLDRERALLRAERDFANSLVDTAQAIVLVLDPDGKIVRYNRFMETISGYPLNEMEGQDWFENFVPPAERTLTKEVFLSALQGQSTAGNRGLLLTRTDEPREVEWYDKPLTGAGGNITGLLSVGLDVTQRALMEREQKEMERLAIIQDKMTSLGRVSAGIAHEIRNPLSGINIYINTLEGMFRGELDNEKTNRIIAQIKSASNKIEAVIKRVMDFSRPSEPALVRLDIRGSVTAAVDLCAVTLRKSGVKLSHDLGQHELMCRADGSLLTQVVLNLITNAAEAMKKWTGEKCIAAITRSDEEWAEILVSDSGPGVSDEVAARIFEPFFTTKDYSTGIGLSLSRRIITDHGGNISVRPGPEGGAEFLIRIPLAQGGPRT